MRISINPILRLSATLAVTLLICVPALADGVLVFGGTGRLGAETVKALIAAKEKVVVFARPTSDRSRLEGLDVSFVVGDMLNREEMIAAFQAVQPRIVIDASALYDAKHEEAVRNIVAGAKTSGVEQIIHHGSVGAGDNMALFPHIDFAKLETAPTSATMVSILLDKGRAEAILVESGLTYTIIRNGLMENDDSKSSGRARMTEDPTALGRITRVDLAAITMECFAAQRCANKIFHALDDNLSARPPAEGSNAE